MSMDWKLINFPNLAEPILDHTTKYYSSPANLDKGILDLVKNRLAKTKHRLICARCGKWERVVETNEVKNLLYVHIVRLDRLQQPFTLIMISLKLLEKNMMEKNYLLMKNTNFIVPGKCLL